MNAYPKILYKFKSEFRDQQDVRRFDAILQNNTIYMPNYKQVNDKLESMNTLIHIGVPGISYAHACGQDHSIIMWRKKQYRLLCLTNNIHSTTMWANYASDYKGYCLVFSADDSFSQAKEMDYDNQQKIVDGDSLTDDEFETAIMQSLLSKKAEWSYEKEWRILEKKEAGDYSFKQDELLGIVIGHEMDKLHKEYVLDSCAKRGIPCFTTWVYPSKSTIVFYPACLEIVTYTTIEEMYELVMGMGSSSYFKMFCKLNHDILNSEIPDLELTD